MLLKYLGLSTVSHNTGYPTVLESLFHLPQHLIRKANSIFWEMFKSMKWNYLKN